MTLATALGSLVVFVCACFIWLNSVELNQEQHRVSSQRIILEHRYQNEFAPLQQRLTSAASVQASVELARRLQQEAALSPERLFNSLSSVFSQPRFASLQLDSLVWKKYTATELGQLLQAQQASVSEPLNETQLAQAQEQAAQAAQAQADAPAGANLRPSVTLSGYFNRGGRSYRETVALMAAFADALRALPQVQQVVVVSMPVDVRPALIFGDTAFGDTSGIELEQSAKLNERMANSYEILMGFTAAAGASAHE
jgi:SNF2 family DNA or RNA helicase